MNSLWQIQKLGNFIEQIRGVSYKKNEAQSLPVIGKLPLLRANNISEDGLNFNELVYVPVERIKSFQKLKKLDIVIAASSGSIHVVGKAAQILNDWDGSFGAFCKVIRTKKGLDSRYLAFFFRTKYYRKVISNLAAGANINNLKNEHFDDLKIPLPPLVIQKKIAAILDLADRLRQLRKAAIEKLDRLTHSVFLDMFGDPATNPKGWEIGQIRDLTKDVKYGTSKKSEKKGSYPILRMGNITSNGSWDFTDLNYIDLESNEVDKCTVRKGDLLFNRTNSKDLVGKTAVFKEEKSMVFAGYLIRLRTNQNANSDFISGFLNSSYSKKVLKNMCKNIIGMANINAQELQNIKIMMPPIQLQNKYSDFINNILRQKEVFLAHKSKFDSLFHSLLQRAFKGELVFNDEYFAQLDALEKETGREVYG
jgi:type I restriction enzyme S subunit